jgi:hypothetical protein
MTDVERAAQFTYGWENWNDPLCVVLAEAQERFVVASMPPSSFLVPFATTLRSRYSSLR